MKIKKNSFFKSSEEVISMFLGLVIVVVVVGLVINFFNKRKGITNIPGVQDEIAEQSGEIISEGEYLIQKGDNLWKIAEKKYNDGYKWTEIAKANKINNPGLIEEGQKLIIPGILSQAETVEIKAEETVSIEPQSNSNYVVVRNDNLWKIAVSHYNDGYQWVKIWNANRNVLNHPDRLEIGMTLILP